MKKGLHRFYGCGYGPTPQNRGVCEGYSGIRIRSDDPYICNVASGGAQYIIVWLYAELRT